MTVFAALPAWSDTIIVPEGGSIQAAIAASASGDTILVKGPAVYTETGQIVIDKDLTIIGIGRPTIKPAQDTGSSETAQGWWYVTANGHLALKGVILDGDAPTRQIIRGIYGYGGVDIADCEFRHIKSGTYLGAALSLRSDSTVTNNYFWDIGRIGIHVNIGEFKITGNTYVGKGPGDGLDYGIELEVGALATITDNIISNCQAVAASDGSTSAGIYMTTYFGGATTTTGILSNNVVTNNSYGIQVGYEDDAYTETSICEAHNNYIYDNTVLGIAHKTGAGPTVHAERNIWGTTDLAAIAAMVAGNVDYDPPSSLSAKGDKGDQGDQGLKGDKGDTGDTV